MERRVWAAAAAVAALWWMAAGCAGTSRPSSFYLLEAVSESAAPLGAGSGGARAVVLGPIRLAAYLDRAQMVTRTGGSELSVEEFHRWGEPLKEAVYRVVQENLSAMLGTAAVYSYPEQPRTGDAVQVVVEVTRFDTDEAGRTTLVAFWRVKDPSSPGSEAPRKSALTAEASAGDWGDRVRTQSRLLAEFSREIAAAVSGK